MVQKFLGVCLLLGLWSCRADAPPDQTQASRFRTSSPSHLYFKNTRSFYYAQSRWKDTRMDRYLLRALEAPDRRPLIIPVILDNWMEDEAYLFFEAPPGHLLDSCRISWRPEESREAQGTYRLREPTPAGYSRLALDLYGSLRKGHSLEIQNPDSTFSPLFADSGQRTAFFTVLRDYFKLIDAQ